MGFFVKVRQRALGVGDMYLALLEADGLNVRNTRDGWRIVHTNPKIFIVHLFECALLKYMR